MRAPCPITGEALRWIGTVLWLATCLAGHTRAVSAQDQPPEIVELARALKHDPDLIYEYVLNNIETLPQFGSLKGPLGTLLDGKGTSHDQAELMIALLRQSGFEAYFVYGRIKIKADELTNWLGWTTATAASTARWALGDSPALSIRLGQP